MEGNLGDTEAGRPTRTMPLRRGNACLRCRQRKMKCDANQDGCHNCTKARQACQYDSSIPSKKSSSKMKSLEEKIAALEQKLSSGGMQLSAMTPISTMNSHPVFYGGSGTSDSIHGQFRVPSAPEQWGPADLHRTPAHPLRSEPSQPRAENGRSFPSDAGGASYEPYGSYATQEAGQYTSTQQQVTSFTGLGTLPQTSVPLAQDNSFVIPDMFSPKSQEIMEGILQGAQLVPEYPSDGSSVLPWSVPSLSNLCQPIASIQDQAISNMTNGLHKMQSNISAAETPWSFDGNKADSQAPAQSSFTTDSSPIEIGSRPEVIDSTLMGGWHDNTDIPVVLRDKLLGHFERLGSGAYHIQSKFRVRLTLEPRKRPHPCWLYAMYLIGAMSSGDSNLMSLQDHFFTVAKQQFEKAVESSDRLLDAVRASNLLSGYLYASAKYMEAYIMTGTGARMAIACGLHSISSSVFTEVLKDYPDASGKMLPTASGKARISRFWALPPPTDAVDLGERINAFWSIFTNDRAGATAMRWPVCIPIETITTPCPHDFEAYASGRLTTANDQTIDDLLHGRKNGSAVGVHPRVYIMRACVLMHEIGRLAASEQIYGSPPESGPEQSAVPDEHEQELCPEVRYPRLYRQYTDALHKFTSTLPPRLRDPLRRIPGRNTPDIHAITLHCYICIAQLWLEDRDEDDAENTSAVQIARKLVTLARAIPDDQFDDVDIYVCMCLIWGGRVLIKELKRLSFIMEDYLSCASVEHELDDLVRALERLGGKLKLAEMQVIRVKDWRDKAGATAEMFNYTAQHGINPQYLK